MRVYPGASKPLLLPAKHDPEIHGADGLGGVEGLPDVDDPEVLALFAKSADGSIIRALDGMSKTIKETWNTGKGQKVTVISSGPMTNIARKYFLDGLSIDIEHLRAVFVSVYPELIDAVEEFVFMGGGVGLGNRSAVAGLQSYTLSSGGA